MRPPLRPYVPAEQSPAEFTLLAVGLGILVAVLFGAANAFVGLKTGLTVTASIPAAVISMAVLRGVLRRGTILENNIVQTVGSTGESLAAGVIFTIPALIFLEVIPKEGGLWALSIKTFLISVAGGLLGVLIMIPLRRYLMVREHQALPFPEGTACAQVLVTGEEMLAASEAENEGRPSKARFIFLGMGAGGGFSFLAKGLGLWREEVGWTFARLHKAGIAFELSPILLGVGYLVGPRIALIMLSGGLLQSLVIIPLFDLVGQAANTPLLGAAVPVAQMSAGDIWDQYVRYIGAGGVALGGAVALMRAVPTMFSSIGQSLRGLRSAAASDAADGQGKAGATPRTERDLPAVWILVVSGLILLALWLIPGFDIGLVGALLAFVFSFFFVAVSARMVGLIGTTSQPVSGLTITALLFTTVVFSAMGWSGPTGMAAAITVGAVVSIAICMSGDIAQDLKTGVLVGATPRHQQVGEVIGTLSYALVAGLVLYLIHEAYTLGSEEVSAPQARLMADLVRGVMDGNLPWGLIGIGVAIGICVELMGIPSLPFAIGLYLPVSTSAAIVFGGVIAWWVARGKAKTDTDTDTTPPHEPGLNTQDSKLKTQEAEGADAGTLFASGLVAGAALMSLVVAALTIIPLSEGKALIDLLQLRTPGHGAGEDLLSIAAYGVMFGWFVWLLRKRSTTS